MQDPAGDIRSVLARLREMAQYCRDERRPDIAAYYEDAIAFINQRIYGKLPPRKQVSHYSSSIPNVQVNLQASSKTRAHQLAWKLASFVDTAAEAPPAPWSGIRVKTSECPLQKIVCRFYKPRGANLVPYESLSCGHEQLGPIGHEVLRHTRRCKQCRQEQLYANAQKKKPASVTTAKSKAVGA